MIHVEKTMFHAMVGFIEYFTDILSEGEGSQYTYQQNKEDFSYEKAIT